VIGTRRIRTAFVVAVAATLLGCSDSDDEPSADAGVVSDAAASSDAVEPDEVDAALAAETLVFVASAKYNGNLGGLAGGDEKCQALADAANLAGTYLAWLGDGTDGPATRFVQSERPYRLVGGDVIADNWADLIDGTIAAAIDRDETGTRLPGDDDMIVWTAVFHTGGDPTPVHCSAWTSMEETLVPTGLASETDTGWTVFAPHNCSEMHRLYCFEQ
jgi:hypothetical protein